MYTLERRSALFGLLFTTHPKFKRQIWGLARVGATMRKDNRCPNCGVLVGRLAYRPIGLAPNKRARICQTCGEKAAVREAPDQS